MYEAFLRSITSLLQQKYDGNVIYTKFHIYYNHKTQ